MNWKNKPYIELNKSSHWRTFLYHKKIVCIDYKVRSSKIEDILPCSFPHPNVSPTTHQLLPPTYKWNVNYLSLCFHVKICQFEACWILLSTWTSSLQFSLSYYNLLVNSNMNEHRSGNSRNPTTEVTEHKRSISNYLCWHSNFLL